MKKFIIVLIALLLIPNIVHADEYKDYLDVYDLSSFEDELDEDTYSFLESFGLTDFDYNRISSIGLNDVLNLVRKIASGRLETPLKSALIILAYILLSSFFQSFKLSTNGDLNSVYSTISALIIATILLVKMKGVMLASAMSISVASNFIFAFIPTFCAIVIASGCSVTAFSTNTLLLSLAQCLSFVASNVFMPLINCFLAIGICSSLRAELRLDKLIQSLKRVITTSISFLSASFVSILSIKTAVASKTDAIGLRSIRFAINSVVPVIGSAISEGLLSIQSYSSLIKSTVGIVGIIAIALVFLPAIIEVVIWRFMLTICSLVSDMFDDKNVSLTITAFKDTMLLINVVLILSMVTTIISFGILIAIRS